MEQNTLISFRNIVKSFDGQMILKGVNLDINEKEFVTLLGPRRLCSGFWAVSWMRTREVSSSTARRSARNPPTSGS